MLKIGDFSKLARVSNRMLRHYDEIGLLHPVHIDAINGYRYYEASQLITAGRITALREMGFGLAEISAFLAASDQPDQQQVLLLRRRQELEEEARQTAYRLMLLASALRRLGKEDTAMKYDVNVKTLPRRYAATVRMVIPSYEQEGLLWNTLMSETARMHLVYDNPCYCCAVFHDAEYRETDVEVEVQQTLQGEYTDTEHVRFRTLPEVTVATTMVHGPYTLMDEANAAVAAWVSENGYAFDGPMFSIYHVSPHETQNPFCRPAAAPVKADRRLLFPMSGG